MSTIQTINIMITINQVKRVMVGLKLDAKLHLKFSNEILIAAIIAEQQNSLR